MTFSIPCATFARLAPVALQPGEPPMKDKPPRPFLACVRIEHVNGMAIAIATNSAIMAIEYLGNADGPNGSFNIGITPTLLAQCIKEAPFNSTLTAANLSVRTTLGFTEMSFASQEFVDWRTAIPSSLPKKSTGAMILDSEHTVRLIKSSPSGFIIFPKFFDREWIVIVRDPHNENWYGTFLSREFETGTPATVPDWVSNNARS
jgi:hypothetical protein